MGLKTPWVTGFLCNILISYLERHYPSDEKKINYAGIISAEEGFHPPKDPKAFLRDSNHWFPHSFLKELIRAGERLTRKKDLAYLATLDYFDPSNPRLPFVFEMITEMLQDVQLTLGFSDHWAGVYTNYLKLQTCEPQSHEGHEVVILSYYEDFVHPVLANNQFVQGHMEGFPRLYHFVESSHCEEEISQLRLEDIVKEFSGYQAEVNPQTILIREDRSGKKIVEAEAVYLETEQLLRLQNPGFPVVPIPIVQPQKNRVQILSPKIHTRPRIHDDAQQAYKAYRVTRGGILESEGLRWSLQEGQIFNAAYSRYRLTWREKQPFEIRESEQQPSLNRARHLLGHLNSLKESQIQLLQYTTENRGLQAENFHLRQEVQEKNRFGHLIGKSPKMLELFSLLESLSQLDTTVLILGETGTGKELVARAIHYNSPRRGQRFLAINCGALAESLLESELFGYERGAFTGAVARHQGRFEQADGGTLFLDEIGEISSAMQIKLLRVLEEGEVQRIGGREETKIDVRVIAATHQNLKELVAQGRFRKDLYYRLNVVEVKLPPLRERLEDLPVLAEHFLETLRPRFKKAISGISPEAVRHLLNYSWPGNIRELRHVIERAMVLAKPAEPILPENLPLELQSVSECGSSSDPCGLLELLNQTDWSMIRRSLNQEGSLSSLLKRIEECIVQKAVCEHQGNKTKAARTLKRSYRWLRKLETRHHS
ncbi:MAG: sigma-54 dependent transcriptional regulator [Nitrospira sp.]|nr:sigma-54 dependent transcriptional regulator [Nitrospira sp.]